MTKRSRFNIKKNITSRYSTEDVHKAGQVGLAPGQGVPLPKQGQADRLKRYADFLIAKLDARDPI